MKLPAPGFVSAAAWFPLFAAPTWALAVPSPPAVQPPTPPSKPSRMYVPAGGGVLVAAGGAVGGAGGLVGVAVGSGSGVAPAPTGPLEVLATLTSSKVTVPTEPFHSHSWL